uniref:Reverse transcriptase domain-containing protein n=2 Tax=Micrurus lemniscatus lemniscatus TaxID=129467 RepID=A0A2D4IPM9_MICLE
MYIDELLPHLVKLFNEILQTYSIPQTWKTSEIVTILKMDRDLRDPGSYRPISLANQDYKIFMKVIANRVESILPKIIQEDQYGFVKGRKISEPIRNVVNVLHHATVTKRKLGILKLDMYKAFDKVNHSYLYELCKELNMGDKFCEMIKEIYRGNEAYIRVNGQRTQMVKVQNGTKQGCPLSPMLFVMAIETLANKIRQDNTWQGYKIGELEMKLNLFADDAIILTQTPIEMIKRIQIILQEFRQQSGLVVNMGKSEFMCLNTGPKEQIEARKESGLKLGLKKMKYLGVWLFSNPGKIIEVNYRQIWRKMIKQMKSWKKKGLRRMAKIRALKMMIVPKMMYLFQVLPGDISRAKLRDWGRTLNYWVEEDKRPRVRKKWLIANEKDGGWGSPSLELYRDAFQIEKLMELQVLENKWVSFEKEINGIKNRELIFTRWNKSDLDKLMGPLKGSLEIWKKWQGKLGLNKSKLSSLYVINRDNETNLNRAIGELKEKGITRIEQLYEKDARVSRNRIEWWLGQQRWLQINAICKYLNERVNKEALLREDTVLEKILREKSEGANAQASNIYRMLTQADGCVIQGLTRCWENELQIDIKEMKNVVENIRKKKILGLEK